MIYMFIKSPNLSVWLANEEIQQSLKELEQEGFAEESDIFSETLDTDYQAASITRGSFVDCYYSFIEVCCSKLLREDQVCVLYFFLYKIVTEFPVFWALLVMFNGMSCQKMCNNSTVHFGTLFCSKCQKEIT